MTQKTSTKRGKGKPFQKGVSPNPGGRPKLTPEDKIVKELTRKTWNDLSEKMMTCSTQELQELLAGDPPAEVEIFVRHILELAENPDWAAYEKYLARRIGPVPAQIDLNIHPKPTVIRKLDGSSVHMTTEEKDE